MRDQIPVEMDTISVHRMIDAVSMLWDEFYSMIEGYEYTDDQGWWFNRERAHYHMDSLTGNE